MRLDLFVRVLCLPLDPKLVLLLNETLAAFLFLLMPLQPCWAAMDYAKQVLIESDFSNRDLRGVTFNLTNLLKANLSGSDLEGASLFGAKLQNTFSSFLTVPKFKRLLYMY